MTPHQRIRADYPPTLEDLERWESLLRCELERVLFIFLTPTEVEKAIADIGTPEFDALLAKLQKRYAPKSDHDSGCTMVLDDGAAYFQQWEPFLKDNPAYQPDQCVQLEGGVAPEVTPEEAAENMAEFTRPMTAEDRELVAYGTEILRPYNVPWVCRASQSLVGDELKWGFGLAPENAVPVCWVGSFETASEALEHGQYALAWIRAFQNNGGKILGTT